MPDLGGAPDVPFLVTPPECLVIGGPAEAFEQHLQDLFRAGHQQVVVDLGPVQRIDSAGIRALVRGHTTAEQAGGRLTLARPSDRTMRLLRVTRLDTVLHIRTSLESARA